MPNYVTNIVKFEGDEARIHQLRESIKGKEADELIDFNKILPMPPLLVETKSGSTEHIAKKVIDFIKAEPLTEVLEDHLDKVIESMLPKEWSLQGKDKENIIKKVNDHITAYEACGYTSWYDWSCDHWGTKWNACDQSDGPDENNIVFETAWSTPVPVMLALSEQFPDIKISVEYADEDIGSNCGRYVLLAGEQIDSYRPSGEEAMQFACDVTGYDYQELLDERKEDKE